MFSKCQEGTLKEHSMERQLSFKKIKITLLNGNVFKNWLSTSCCCLINQGKIDDYENVMDDCNKHVMDL